MLLSDATARYDDLNEGQLGDVLFEVGRAYSHFGVQVRQRWRRQARSQACGLRTRLGRRIARGFGAVRLSATVRGGPGGPRPRLRRRRAGPLSSRAGCRGNLAGGIVRAIAPRLWPASRRTASRFSGRGPAAVPGCHAVPSNQRPLHARLADGTAGWDASSLGSRSMWREEAAALLHAGLPAGSCRNPSSRRCCGTPPRGRAGHTSLSQLR